LVPAVQHNEQSCKRGIRASKWRWSCPLLCVVTLGLLAGCNIEGANEDSVPTVQALTASGISVSLTYESDSKAGYCSTLSLTNTGTTSISTWQVVVDLGQATLGQFLRGSTNLSGQRMTVTPLAANAYVLPGTCVSVGFCANAAGPNYHPTLVSASSSSAAIASKS
jgi:hypothetical protein